jgi:galactose mutarotase-like enzyme
MGPQVGNFSTEQMKEYGYDLAQHGFLRNVEREKEKYKNKIAYLFKSNPETFAKFPYRFDALQTIKLEEDSAEI